jgi:uncharacterized protein (DUF1919 family)
MIEFVGHDAQTRFDIAQTLSISQLGKGHAEELFPTGKVVNLVIALVSFDTLVELVPGQEVDELRKRRLRT